MTSLRFAQDDKVVMWIEGKGIRMMVRNTLRMASALLALAACSISPMRLMGQDAPPPLYLGAAWYPEQWPEVRWEADLKLMEEAHVRFVRIGEFAWSTMEPKEGDFEFAWMDHAIAMAAKHHIDVVLGTPSAAPPAWLTQKYPETLRIMEDGRQDAHGNRQQFNWANPKYRELAAKVAGEMAKRYGHNPHVIGWQIDNEYANESYGKDVQKQFQDWCKAHYGTLDNLNTRWTTTYWSESYSDWSQIPIEEKEGNPGLLLSWKRFVSDTWRSYQKNQIDAIHASSDKRQWITTNMMGWFDAYDHYTVAKDLDMASWDDYVRVDHLDPVFNGAAHDLTRGFLRKNFWVMETQPGFVNWKPNNVALDKGEVRAMAWHDIGHGADAVEYWQWRSALNGQEELHGTVVGADGTPEPLYPEVQQIGAEFAKAGESLKGTSVHSEVAILHSYESRWAINWQRHNQAFDPVTQLLTYYKPLRELSQSIDIVAPTAPLSSYKLVVAPGLAVLTNEAAKNLMEYVKGGGHLVLGQRAAIKDGDNGLQPMRQPGPLGEMLGGRVEQFYALADGVPFSGAMGAGTSKIWAEQLSTSSPDTKVLMTYGPSNGWLDGQPAVITRKVGKGEISYIGAWLGDGDESTKGLAKWMVESSGVAAAWGPVPEGVEVTARSGGGKKVFILVNFAKTEQTVHLPASMLSVLDGRQVGSVTLGRYGVAVLEAK
ncbi:beta-galactosidase [Granulicella sibirica]|uniref:beta-galactosidase n=1 Tax=Granulicella sibirica TaxID=2479048 RepID=UPI001F4FDB9A|nr:beta-galactosidase [Granulicella sibirica]